MPEPNETIKQLVRDYQMVFQSEQGKRVLDDLKKRLYFNNNTFDKDPYVHAFQSGNQAVIVTILNMMEMDLKRMEDSNDD